MDGVPGVLLAGLLAAAPTTSPRSLALQTATMPAQVFDSTQFELSSQGSSRVYRIFVFKPSTPPPPTGYPVVTLIDGNGMFGTAAMQMWIRQHGELRPALIVGVGYPTNDYTVLNTMRFKDLTPDLPSNRLPAQFIKEGRPVVDMGGEEAFFRFLVDELRPSLNKAFRTDLTNQTLYGHSLGGLFALSVLFRHPRAFRTYVASSPSIYWGNCAVLDAEPEFRRKVAAGAVAPRVLIEVGALEQTAPTAIPGASKEALAVYAKAIADNLMIDNAKDLSERLAAIPGTKGYKVEFDVFDQEGHLSVIPASISRALGFALSD